MKQESQSTMGPSRQSNSEVVNTTTGMLGLSERILSILRAQPLNPLVKLEMRSMGRTEQELICGK